MSSYRIRASLRLSVLVGPLALCMLLACGSDGQRCTEPELTGPPLAYMFREVALDPGDSLRCVLVYWYFESVDGRLRYIGHFDPRDGEGEPAWLIAARAIESCYDSGGTGCTERLWTYCSDPGLTPREDEEAEEAALWLSGSLVAPPDLYEMVKHDLAEIRACYRRRIPEVASIHFYDARPNNSMWLRLSSEAYEKFSLGEYHDLDSLNTLFGVINAHRNSSLQSIELVFRGRYNIADLYHIYSSVPSVIGMAGWALPRPPCGHARTVIPWPIPAGSQRSITNGNRVCQME